MASWFSRCSNHLCPRSGLPPDLCPIWNIQVECPPRMLVPQQSFLLHRLRLLLLPPAEEIRANVSFSPHHSAPSASISYEYKIEVWPTDAVCACVFACARACVRAYLHVVLYLCSYREMCGGSDYSMRIDPRASTDTFCYRKTTFTRPSPSGKASATAQSSNVLLVLLDTTIFSGPPS